MRGCETSIDYEPAESTTGMFGGNSNWRGPIWFPVNYLVVDALFRYARFFGDELKLEYPTGSGSEHTLAEIGEDLRRRLISLFLVGEDGRRPCYGWVDRLQNDPPGRTTSSSTSTSTATTAPGSAPRTRPGGRGSSRT